MNDDDDDDDDSSIYPSILMIHPSIHPSIHSDDGWMNVRMDGWMYG
jgi:hypothetical protein